MTGQSKVFSRVVDKLEYNKKEREQGKDIVIPIPFPRLQEHFPGLEQATYYIVSGNQKSAKTQITDELFLYTPIDFIRNNNTNIDVKIFYFTLEMSKEAKIRQTICRRLYQKKGIVLSPRKLQSLFSNYILEDDILEFIKEDKEYFDFLESKVEFIDFTKNPFGIFKTVRDHFHANGEYISKTGEVIPINLIEANTEEVNKTISHYRSTNPSLFTFIVVDHISLIKEEKVNGVEQTLYEAIKKLSNDYLITIRDRWGGIPVAVQQQNLDKEGNESMKMGTTEPSASGLADFKGTGKDCNVLFTIYSPFRNKIKEYNGYDITLLKDNYRRLAIELDRNGSTCETNLFFNGAVNFFQELPKPNEMTQVYNKIRNNQKL